MPLPIAELALENTFFARRRHIRKNTLPVRLPIAELALVYISVLPRLDALTVRLPVIPLALVTPAILPRHDAPAVRHVIKGIALIAPAVLPRQDLSVRRRPIRCRAGRHQHHDRDARHRT